MTQIELARKGTVSSAIKYVAQREQLAEDFICEYLTAGKIVIPVNRNRHISHVCGIGKGLRIKVNANIAF